MAPVAAVLTLINVQNFRTYTEEAKTYEFCHTVCVFVPLTLHFEADFKQARLIDNLRMESPGRSMLSDKLAVLVVPCSCIFRLYRSAIQIVEGLWLLLCDPTVFTSLFGHHVQIEGV